MAELVASRLLNSQQALVGFCRHRQRRQQESVFASSSKTAACRHGNHDTMHMRVGRQAKAQEWLLYNC